jgi:hypothetical protein
MNKTISIHPHLFHLKKNKTKKNAPIITSTTTSTKPLISPKLMKQRLLHRIKQHKNKEIHTAMNTATTAPSGPGPLDSSSSSVSDEFSKSMEYLQTLSKQKQLGEKQKYEENKKRSLERKTLKHLGGGGGTDASLMVHLDLPEELEWSMPFARQSVSDRSISDRSDPIVSNHLSHPVSAPPNDPVPYGILKGGKKPTYRMWNKTQRQGPPTTTRTPEKNERDQRLYELRQKLQKKQMEKQLQQMQSMPSIQPPPMMQPPMMQPTIQSPIMQPMMQPTIQSPMMQPTIQSPIQSPMQKIATKHITTKTIRKKYTLGKSKTKNVVSVMIKNKGTQKKIIDAQRELKKTNIEQIKKYLVDQNLIKMGSNAPNDILRKMYESAFMTGEIKNADADILLHNYSKDKDKE